jgi:hypothetical protein
VLTTLRLSPTIPWLNSFSDGSSIIHSQNLQYNLVMMHKLALFFTLYALYHFGTSGSFFER